MTNTTNTTKVKYLRMNITKATLIKLACEKIEEEVKLNMTNDEYIELLKIISCVSKHISQTQQNKTHMIVNNDNKVIL